MSKEKLYLVTAIGGISLTTIVKATSTQEARKLALDNELARPGYEEQGSHYEQWHGSGEYDCTLDDANIIDIEELDIEELPDE